MITATEYQQRREKLLSLLPEKAVVVVFSGREKIRNGDSNYIFSPERNFYYLTGIDTVDTIAVISHDNYQLFIQASDPAMERWLGKRMTTQQAIEKFHADEAYTLDQFTTQLATTVKADSLIYSTTTTLDLLDELQPYHKQIDDLMVFIGECRLVKSDNEIAMMQHAADISSHAHKHVMQVCKPGLYEYQLEAEFNYQCAMQGARFQAYPPIFAAGANACTLHYEKNQDKLKEGDLILIDAGCEYQHYESDITRTFPINGKFTEPQKAIYQLVLDTQLAIIELIKPGIKFESLQQSAIELLTAGLVNLGILRGEVKKLIAEKAYADFYMHGVSHWLGLDTHDCGQYTIDGQSRELQSGNVLTVEPGIYIAADNMAVDAKWRGIGVRIEDDVVVTKTGHRVLSDVPKTIDEIECLLVSKH